MHKNVETTAYRVELHDRILSAAMDMFRKRGVRSVKMDDIATALSVSKRTLYEIFDNKEVLLLEGVRMETERRREAAYKSFELHPSNVMDMLLSFYHNQMEEISGATLDFFTDINRYPRVLKYLRDQEAESKQNARRFFERGIEEGYFRPDVNYDIVTRVTKMGIDGVMKSNMFDEYSLSEIFSNMIMTFFRGICTAKGLEVLDNFSMNK